MKLFTFILMLVVAYFGITTGFKTITGRDLVRVKWPLQSAGPRTAALAPRELAAPTAMPIRAPTATPARPYERWWVQNHMETELWSGPDDKAVSFGKVPQWSYFQVIAPQEGPRLRVLNPVTNGEAYIDASAVGPSSPPTPSGESAAETPAVSETAVVGNSGGAGVYLRRTPNMNDRIRAWVDGTRMAVLERGIESDGASWARVKSPDDVEGYVPEQYLVPAS